MSLSLFIARRLYQGGQKERQVSRPAVLIAKAGIAIGLAVMIIAVCVIVGFKSEVRDKVVGFGGHIQINNLEQTQPYEPMPVGVEKSLMDTLLEFPQVEHIQRYAVKPGMLKMEDLAVVRKVALDTGMKYMVYFGERVHVEGALFAQRLIDSGKLGKIVTVTILAPHRLNPSTRPDWFFDPEKNGGILADIGSHQVEQLLSYTHSPSFFPSLSRPFTE